MKVSIVAVGRQKASPEVTLLSDYLTRFARTGRALGLGPARVIEVEDKKGMGPAAEAELLRRAIPADALVVMLDERGQTLTSPQFATHLAGWRDAGRKDLALVIGGADGLLPELRARADLLLSFGPMVWPHMLVRAMLAEQLYRAATILSGTPYHRA